MNISTLGEIHDESGCDQPHSTSPELLRGGTCLLYKKGGGGEGKEGGVQASGASGCSRPREQPLTKFEI